MMAKLLEVLQNSNSNSEGGNPIPGFDMDAFRRKAAQTLRTSFRSMDEKSRLEFLAWISAVRSIRNSDLNFREKEMRLSELPNTETAMKTLKAVLDAAVSGASEEDQKGLKTSLSGIKMATSLMNWKTPPMALMLVSQALPKFLLAPQFEIVATFLEQELERLMKELNSPQNQR